MIFLSGSERWTMRKQDEKGIVTIEMSQLHKHTFYWLLKMAEILRLQEIGNVQ